MQRELQEALSRGVDALCALVIFAAVVFSGRASINRLGYAVKKRGESWRPSSRRRRTVKGRARWSTASILLLTTIACLLCSLDFSSANASVGLLFCPMLATQGLSLGARRYSPALDDRRRRSNSRKGR